MKISSLDSLMTLATLKEQDVVITPNGDAVRIRELTLAQRSEFSERNRGDSRGAAVWLVVTACVDDDGNRLMTDADAEKLQLASPRIIEEIGIAVLKLSGLVDAGAPEGNVSAPSSASSTV
jgi:hypothetical protein